MQKSVKLPDVPRQPKSRGLRLLGKKLNPGIPYVIAGQLDEEYIITKKDGSLDIAVGNLPKDVFCILLAPLYARHYQDYELNYNQSIDSAVGKILYIVGKEAAVNRLLLSNDINQIEDESEEDYKIRVRELIEVTKPKMKDEIMGMIYETPFGDMYGSIDKNVLELALYVLSAHGRIIGKKENGDYDLREITPQDIDGILDPNILKESIDGENIFNEILNVSNLFNTDELREELEHNKELTDDELKN